MAKTEVLDQISAAMIEMFANVASTNQGMGFMTPNSRKKLLSKPILSLKIYFH